MCSGSFRAVRSNSELAGTVSSQIFFFAREDGERPFTLTFIGVCPPYLCRSITRANGRSWPFSSPSIVHCHVSPFLSYANVVWKVLPSAYLKRRRSSSTAGLARPTTP
jgi:hypothetical protein